MERPADPEQTDAAQIWAIPGIADAAPKERIAAAAALLRELAESADTPGARDLSYYNVEDGNAEWCSGPREQGYRTGCLAYWAEEDDGARLSYAHADYFSTVHPGVGLALAAWLADEAVGAQTESGEPTAHAVAVADEVLGINVVRALMAGL